MRDAAALPAVLVPLLLHALSLIHGEGPDRGLDTVEFMSGAAAVTKSASALGMASVGFDKTYHKNGEMDILTERGWHNAVLLTLRVKPHGSIWLAPVCSTWVWVGRFGSGRTSANARGNVLNHRIRLGNMMVVRCVVIMLLAWARGVHLWLENPSGTLIHEFSPLREFLTACMPWRCTAHMCSYGASSQKTMWIWSTSNLVNKLERVKRPVKERLCVVKKVNGRTYVTGLRKELKSSQAYPLAFGQAVANLFATIKKRQNIHDMLDATTADNIVKGKGNSAKRKYKGN